MITLKFRCFISYIFSGVDFAAFRAVCFYKRTFPFTSETFLSQSLRVKKLHHEIQIKTRLKFYSN